MSEKLYKVQMNSKGMPDFSTAVEVADRPSAVYEYLKRKIGDTVDSETEFDAWFNRMVWHVEECNRLADKPQGEWIPCSERLPKSYVEVLVCDDFGWINLGAYRPCDVSEDCSGWSIHAHTKIGTEEVVAWMPLPKPWKGADDDIDNV